MRLNHGLRYATAAIVVVCGVAQAQVSIDTRLSTQDYQYLYGWSIDLHDANETFIEGALNQSDSMSTSYTGYTEGEYLPTNTTWTAGIDGLLQHEYTIGGPLSAAWMISASGRSDGSVAATGSGYAENWSKAPGNELIFEFDVTAPVDYSLNATYDGNGNSRPSYLALQFFSGGFWNYIPSATNFFNGALSGSLFDSGTLGTGRYRMVSNILLDTRTLTGHPSSQFGEFNYSLQLGAQPVPEPSSLALLGVGVAALARRMRKAKK